MTYTVYTIPKGGNLEFYFNKEDYSLTQTNVNNADLDYINLKSGEVNAFSTSGSISVSNAENEHIRIVNTNLLNVATLKVARGACKCPPK